MAKFANVAVRALENKNVKKYVQIIIDDDVILRGRILSYNYSSNKDFASDQATITLDNKDGTYTNRNWYNKTLILKEGITADGAVHTKTKFDGYIRQVEHSHAGGKNIMNITAFDRSVRFQELEIEEKFEAPSTKITLETVTPNFIAFYAQINGTPSTTSIVYDNVYNETLLEVSDTLYNVSDSYSERTVESIDTDNNIITTTSSSDDWADNDEIVKSTRVQVLDLANTNIATFPESILKIKNRDNELEDPLWEGFQILYEQGQILLGRPINWAEFYIRCTYYYYPTATSLYAEDVIEDIITAEDGYNGIPFTTADNLTETFSNMEGKTVDTLKPNTEIETIGGIVYNIGQVFYCLYSNITTVLTAFDFTVPSTTIDTVDLRYGRIILDSAIATTATVTCNVDYAFKSLQATGIQFTKMEFTYENTMNRLDAINKIKGLIAPNYVFQTRGSDKLWGRYVYQKDAYDYVAKNILNLSIAEDTETYTRVRLFGQNKNPKNILFDSDVSVVQDTSLYYGEVSNQELTFIEESGGWRTYSTGLGEGARIISNHDGIDTWPIVYINNIPIDDDSHELLMQQVEWKRREEYVQECHSWCMKFKIRSYRKYWIYFSHSDIDPSQPIFIYNAAGLRVETLNAYNSEVNYGGGYWFRDVGEGNAYWVMEAATASYFIRYSTGKLEILWDKGKFKVSSSMFSSNRADIVSATFTYSAIYTAPGGIERLIDGRFTTQVQTEFNAKPAAGFTWAIIDLGAAKEIDAIDLVGGFYYPDQNNPARKFNTEGWFTVQYSPDDVDDSNDATFYNLCQESVNFKLGGGESKSWERDKLGESFKARYIKIMVEDLEKIPYGDGLWVVAFSELAIYQDVVLSAEAFLVSDVADEDDNHLYDADGLLDSIGDKVYKITTINENLSDATKAERRAKALLREFAKNHTRITGNLLYAPHFEVGQTLYIADNKNNIANNYFIESISCSNGLTALGLARYPRYKALGGQDPGVIRT